MLWFCCLVDRSFFVHIVHCRFLDGDGPYEGMSNPQVIQQVQAGYRIPKPAGCSKEAYVLMLACWDVDPSGRPPFDELDEKLTALSVRRAVLIRIGLRMSLFLDLTFDCGLKPPHLRLNNVPLRHPQS
jgi:hypothetical protein